MGMADLKRTCYKSDKIKPVDVNQFINDADNYALGLPSLAEQKEAVKALGSKSIRKNATFSLTELSVNELALHADKLNMSKSALIRLLIQYLSSASEIEKRRLLNLLETS
ncbi:hypothetical protein XM47_05195 [Catenovulum maritimum]|uniref:Ribbon-helix-helix protein CopG domain-containing protein n=2 Tax=Catenovulum maritimum TaxID=1513271 RepID=A0A0J8GTU9_9ALTE|nr:hypothetical protein XM47_05195 [Catenovulum maritimum]